MTGKNFHGTFKVMLEFKKAEYKDIESLATLASEIWHEYWVDILTSEQIKYMVTNFQSAQAIKTQIEQESYEYYFIEYENKKIGYFGISYKKDYLFLSKLYLKKDYRHHGFGTKAFQEIIKIAIKNNYNDIQLTVNKYNKNTIRAYEKWGFKIIDSVVTDIGSGFVMDDYIMSYVISNYT